MIIDKKIQQYGKEHNVPISLEETLNFLCKTINQHNCKQALEIGSAIGFGCITMAENSNIEHIDSVEIDLNMFNLASQNINNHNLNNKITLFNLDALDYLKTCNKRYDFVYLDGPKGQYINYLPYIINLLNVGGVIVADNLYFHGMVTGKIPVSKGCRAMIKGLKNYINAIKTNSNLSTTILDVGDGLGVSIKLIN